METIEIWSDRYYEAYEEYLNEDWRCDMNWDLIHTEEFEENMNEVYKFIS